MDSIKIDIHIDRVKKEDYRVSMDIRILYVLKGEVFIESWNGKYKMGKDDMFIVSPCTFYRIIPIDDDTYLMNMSIKEKNNRRLLLYNCIPLLKNTIKYEILNEKIKKITDMIIEEKSIERYLDEYLLELKVLIDNRFNFLEYGIGNNDFNKSKRKIFFDLSNIIYNNRYDSITLKRLSEELGLSYYYLSRLIKEYYSISLKKLHKVMILQLGICLLINTDKSILEISNKCGFSDVKYFIDGIKKIFKCIPTKVRESYREELLQTGEVNIQYINNMN